MKFTFVWKFVLVLVFVASSVTAQWAKVIDSLSNVVTLIGKLEQIFADPLNQPMENISEYQYGSVFYVTAKPKYKDMTIRFIIQVSLDVDIITIVRNSVNSGDSLNQLNQKLQNTGSSNIYETILTVPKGLLYTPKYCNRKYIRACSYTYDVYVGIGSHRGWGWDQNQLKAQTRELQSKYSDCSFASMCPAN